MKLDLVCQTERHVDGVYTSYLTDPQCHWRTAGKGTTAAYCEASAYGEAMEHLSTHYAFNISTASETARKYGGFYRYPDEKVYPLESIPELSPAVMEDLREPYLRAGRKPPEKIGLLSLWKRILGSNTTSFVPFYHVNEGKQVLLPDQVLAKLCGTNGGGCGNTPEEAIGHALDEIVERGCKYVIFSRHLTPPEVPDAYIEKRCPELLQLKQRIEKQGHLKVLVLDASLGKGYPVVLIVLMDPAARRYLVNFGCHPLFELALERCFTEIFQDRRVVPDLLERKDMAVWSDFESSEIDCQRNWIKLLEDDLGLWPEELFGGRPSWPFSEWPVYENYSNRVGMQSQLNRLQKNGADIFIRNVSFLNFPVYKVYIPGVSTSHISFTEDILEDLSVPGKMKAFLREEPDRTEMQKLGEQVFGCESIMGRMFFYRLSNEEFALLHGAFLMEYGDQKRAYHLIRPWNGENAVMAARVLEMEGHMELQQATDCAKRFASRSASEFLDRFFSEHPFKNMLAYYHFSSDSRESMTGENILPQRDALLMKIKDYMAAHMQTQEEIGRIVGGRNGL